jgi:integrative and conjugative element protein (TIGR02256 family)
MSGHCWCARSALDALLAEARRWPIRETGGALLGWREADQWVIAQILGPGPHAKHRLSSFEPDAVWQNEQGHRIYRESGRTIRYLGDWHTHPRGMPRPSRQDRRTARLIAEDPDFKTPQPLYAIAGHRHPLAVRSPWILSLLVVDDGELKPLPLTLYGS